MLDTNILCEDLEDLLQSFLASQPYLGHLTDTRIAGINQSVEFLKELIRKEESHA